MSINRKLGRNWFFKAADPEGRRRLRWRAAIARDRARSVSARPRGAEPDRPHPLPEARNMRRPSTRCSGVNAVDPEDLQMHYTVMLCYRGPAAITTRPRAKRSCSAASRRTSPRRPSRPAARMISPEDNNERQLIHDHESAVASDEVDRRIWRSPLLACSPRARPPAVSSPTSPRRRHPFVHNAGRRARSICRRRWAPGAPSSTPTATAGPTSSWSTARIGPRADASAAGPLPQQPQRHLHRHHRAAAASTSRCMAWAWPSRDYDNDGREDVYITALEGDHLFHN